MMDMSTDWPDYEEARLEELGRYAITFDDPEPAFDSAVTLLCHLCSVPLGGISIVDRDTVWLKARHGVALSCVARSVSFCTLAIKSGDELFRVSDTAGDPRFLAHPMVQEDPHVRYYAATPLISQAGFAIGTLWVMDTKPNALDAEKEELLRMVGSHVERLLDARYLSGPLKLYNQSGFLRQMRDRMTSPDREPLAVGCVNIRGLRYINDAYGHAAGDLAIGEVARHIRLWRDELGESTDTPPVAAHLGGGNFALLVTGAGARGDVAGLVESLRRCTIKLDERPVPVVTTIGLIDCQGDAVVAPALLDRVMLIAREAPNSGVCVLHDGGATTAGDDDGLAIDLRAALAGKSSGGQLEAYFQPSFDLSTARLAGFETLLRWDHPTHGALLPDRFVSLAERIGAGYQLDLYAFDAMCQALSGWIAAGPAPPVVSVNIARTTLLADRLSDALLDVAKEYGISPDRIELEITSAGLVESRTMIDRVAALRAAGFSIAIDAFGTGMSNLDSLTKLPCDTVKIDRQFIGGVASDPRVAQLCRLLIDSAVSLGLRLVCVGVQTQEDARWLAENGGPLVQGWYFAEAVEDDAAESLIRGSALEAGASPEENVGALHRWVRDYTGPV